MFHASVRRTQLMLGIALIVLWGIHGSIPPGMDIENIYIEFFVDSLRLGIAIFIFILPGAFLFLLFRGEKDHLFELHGILPIGFALSVSIIGAIGLIGRFFSFSFEMVENIFMLMGLGELALLALLKPNVTLRKEHLKEFAAEIFGNGFLFWALILGSFFTFNEHLFFIDDTTYQAYLTNWQNSGHLGFNNIIHYFPGVIENERFWLALYPMGQAFLSDLSGVPGILLFGNYLELFLVPLAIITLYWFARTLGLSRNAAGFSALFQVILYMWMIGAHWPVGFWFYLNMAEDKVSAVFLLAPVFFFFVLSYLRAPRGYNLLLVLVSGIGLTLTHPVILFFSCFIATGLAIFSLMTKRSGLRVLQRLAGVFVMLLMPYLFIRLYQHLHQMPGTFDAQSARASFQIERYTNVVNDIFYGLNPEVLKLFDIPHESNIYGAYQILRLLPVFLAVIGAFLAFRRLGKGELYWYVLTSVLLVALATIPYTGWLLGYFVSARLISRASWFSPLGLAGALVFISILNRFVASPVVGEKARSYINKFKLIVNPATRVFASAVMAVFLFAVMVIPRIPPYFAVLDHYRQLAQIGAYIDRDADAPVTAIAANYADTQLLPGVAANVSLISFREEKEDNGHNHFLSTEEIRHRIYASNAISSLDSDVPREERCSLMEEYEVKYVVVRMDDIQRLVSILSGCEIQNGVVYRTPNIALFELQ